MKPQQPLLWCIPDHVSLKYLFSTIINYLWAIPRPKMAVTGYETCTYLQQHYLSPMPYFVNYCKIEDAWYIFFNNCGYTSLSLMIKLCYSVICHKNFQKFCNCRTFIFLTCRPAGPWFNLKMSSYQYRISYCGDKLIVWLSDLHNRISCTGKMTSQ